MAFNFRYNNTTSTVYSSTTRVTTPSICYRKSGTTYYIPLLTSRSQTIGDYVYSASSPTVCARYGGKTYYGAKSRTVDVDIPAGTYTPSAFRTLMGQFMTLSNGNYKKVKNAVTLTVNGRSASLSANDSIYYWKNYISGASTNANLETFQVAKINSEYKTFTGYAYQTIGDSNLYYYIVGFTKGTSSLWGSFGSDYANYSIKVGSGGIKFV